MGDSDPSNFISQLDSHANRHAFDQPRLPTPAQPWGAPIPPAPAWTAQIGLVASPIMPPVAAPPPPAPPAYHGPRVLRPESMCHLMQYYREQPGALIEKLARLIYSVGALLCLATAILVLAFLTSSHPFAHRAMNPAATPPPNPHAGQIGILNPAWVDNKASHRSIDDGTYGFFASDSSSAEMLNPPPKYIYVAPGQAQQILVTLIQKGIVTAAGGPPNVVRDFAKLKGIGITTN